MLRSLVVSGGSERSPILILSSSSSALPSRADTKKPRPIHRAVACTPHLFLCVAGRCASQNEQSGGGAMQRRRGGSVPFVLLKDSERPSDQKGSMALPAASMILSLPPGWFWTKSVMS